MDSIRASHQQDTFDTWIFQIPNVSKPVFLGDGIWMIIPGEFICNPLRRKVLDALFFMEFMARV
jgi:hypothetical protein